jgi:hypothetical protein
MVDFLNIIAVVITPNLDHFLAGDMIIRRAPR